ncbi:armadillo-type protein [Annulohypoxylon truncatum]|uniref:armadillo-type protein n=1 Tax=Annulohypoxylon truncatum TaxID=327061 RepID=UPI002007A96E|nr:armadillo-type protein [Annulohypoxylon truncatum]KAI1212155.1 armadillo-type protein [Annulohypoxylon truncatum]
MPKRIGEELIRGEEKRRRVEHRSSPQPSTRDEPVQHPGQERAVRLHIVYPLNEDESKTDPDIDIIAVHGLGTKSPDTWVWKDPKDPSKPGVNWLEDRHMLPKLVGRARIFTCDWPADLYETSELTQKTIEESARLLLNGIQGRARENRPILFIASCLGGIILIKALDMATQEYSSIRTATRGVIFLATPFRGSSFRNIASWVKPLLRIWASIQSRRVTILLNLTTPTLDLSELVRRFTQLCNEHQYEIITFYERRATNLFRRIFYYFPNFFHTPEPLVDFNSATLDIVPHPLPLDRSHILMNKFQGPDKASDKDFEKVAGKIEWSLKKIRAGTPLEQADAWICDKHYTEGRLKIQRLSGEFLSMDQCYINLAIIKKLGEDARLSEGGSGNLEYQPSPFSLTSRLKVQTPPEELLVELPTLFDPCKMPNGHKEPRRILIRGRAGVGKTTLCKKIIHDFTHGNMWKNLFKRVLWVPLRNLKSRKPGNFEKLFYEEYFIQHLEGKDRAHELSRALLQTLNTEGERTLFILDGLDEVQNLGGEENNEYRFLSELLNQPDVIITTRPHATLPANVGQPDLELETIGFYPHQVQHYLEKVVPDPLTVRDIQSFLQKHWLVRSLVRIPIQLDALCLTWDDDIRKNSSLQTMTAIYKAIVSRLWKKDVLRYGGKEYMTNAFQSEVEAAMEFENEILECFAFSGIYSNLVEFQPEHQDAIRRHTIQPSVRPSDVKSSFYDRLGGLSFLRPSDPSADMSNRSYHFLHLTFQEFFAAKYFARKWESGEELECLDLNSKKAKTIKICPVDFLTHNKYNSRYNIVWRFTVGLLDSEKVPQFFEQLKKSQPDLLGPTHQRLVMHCLSEMDISTDLRLRPELEKGLAEWLLFGCDLGVTSRSLLAAESEFPDQALRTALEAACEKQKSEILRSLRWRGRYLSEATVNYLGTLIPEVESRVRCTVIEALGYQSNLPEEVVTKLMELLQDKAVQESAAKAIRQQSNLSKETVTKLIEVAQNAGSDMKPRYCACLALAGRLSESDLVALATPLRNSDSTTRGHILDIFARQLSIPEQAVTVVVALINDKFLCSQAIRILGNQTSLSGKATTTLAQLLKNADVRYYVAGILKNQSNLSEETTTTLAQLLKNADVRYDAAGILKNQSKLSEETHSALKALLENNDAHIQSSVAEALGVQLNLPEQTVQALVRQLEDVDDVARRNATETLERQPNLSKKVITTLISHLGDDSGICRSAASILENQSSLPEEVIETILQLFDHVDGTGYHHLFSILKKQSTLSERSITALITCLKSKYQYIRYTASVILMKQTSLSEQAIATLLHLVKNVDTEAFEEHPNSSGQSALDGSENRNETAREKESIEICEYAVEILEEQQNLSGKTTEAPMALLKDKREYVQSVAAAALSRHSNLPEEANMAFVTLLKSRDSDIKSKALLALKKQSNLSKDTAKAFLLTFKETDRVFAGFPCRASGDLMMVLDKALAALEPVKLDSQTMECLYRFFLCYSFEEQFSLHVDTNSSLRIDRPNGSRKICLDHSSSAEQILAEVAKWRSGWNIRNRELW